MKIDEKIIRNILESLKDKLVSKRQLEGVFGDVSQDKYSENIIVNLRKNKDIFYIFKGCYHMLDIKEKKGLYTAVMVLLPCQVSLSRFSPTHFIAKQKNSVTKNYIGFLK